MIELLDKGFVRLDAVQASDLAVVNAARVSFAKRSRLHSPECRAVVEPGTTNDDCNCDPNDVWTDLTIQDRGIIRFLMKGRHTSPFEHGLFSFHVKLPLVVVREWQRHRTWSFNELSGRYAQLPAEWYVPARDDIRHQVGKPGAYEFKRVEDDELAEEVRNRIDSASRFLFEDYQAMLDMGIAKEQARLILPVNLYTEMIASVDPLNLMRFLSLRNSEHAMKEIREYAIALEEIAVQHMPVTFAAFVANGRQL
jgi:thymidylate synthase (FAD)